MVLRYEIKKLLSMSALWGFVAVLLIFNTVLALTNMNYSSRIDYINDVCETTGSVYDTEYLQKLSEVKSDGDYMYDELVSAGENAYSPIDSFNSVEAFNALRGTVSPLVMGVFKQKYEKLGESLASRKGTGEGLNVYFGGSTVQIHEQIFVSFGTIIICEVCLTALLTALFSFGYEAFSKTELTVYSTKKGRRLAVCKLGASLICSCLLFIIIFGIGYAVMFAVNDFSGVFNQAVSSVNNFADNEYEFITWKFMTVGQYFGACAGVSLLLSVLFTLIGACAGMVFRNTWAAFGTVASVLLINSIMMSSAVFEPRNFLYYIIRLTPCGVIFNKAFWFIDGGCSSLFAYSETLISAGFVLLFAVLCLAAFKRLKRKDLM